MRWQLGVLTALLAIVVLLVSSSSVTLASTSKSVPGADVAPLTTDATPIPVGTSYATLAPGTSVSLTLSLTNPHSGQLEQFLAQVEDPASGEFRHFLLYSQYLSEYAAPSSTASTVGSVLAAAGARDIIVTPDRSAVTAVLPAATVQDLFGVRLVSYGSLGRLPLYTSVGPVSIPGALNNLVSGVSGLSDVATAELAESSIPSLGVARPISLAGPQFVHDNSSAADWYVGSDYTQAYGATALFPGVHSVANATYPGSVAIATLLGSAFNQSSQADLPPWDPAVIDAYFNGSLGPGWPIPIITGVPVSIDGITPPLPGTFGGENDSTQFEIENSLDLEMAGSLAPGAALYNFYFSGSLLGPTTGVGDAANYLAQDLANALAFNYAPKHLVTVSCSFGLPDLNNSAWNTELSVAAATGVTIVSASGDQGNAPDSLTGRADGPWPVWPATAATNSTGAVSAGGVSVTMSGAPSSDYNGTSLNLSYDPAAGSISSVVTWWDTLGGAGQYAGSEGGTSSVFGEPWWQIHSSAQPAIVNATVRQGASSLGRSGPDVAMPGNSTIATVFANSTGVIFFIVLEGTSVAAPVLAGLLADVVAVENNRTAGPWTSLGFIDPEIYRFASFFATHPAAVGDPLKDVTTGQNYVFSAAPGWDPTTGWGGVDAPLFLTADQNSTLLTYNYNGPTPGLPSSPSAAGTSPPWTFIYLIFAVGVVVAIVLVIFTARSSSRHPPVQAVPWGAHLGGPSFPTGPPAPGNSPGATMLCPYCGAIRPTEPVRCPQCGAF